MCFSLSVPALSPFRAQGHRPKQQDSHWYMAVSYGLCPDLTRFHMNVHLASPSAPQNSAPSELPHASPVECITAPSPRPCNHFSVFHTVIFPFPDCPRNAIYSRQPLASDFLNLAKCMGVIPAAGSDDRHVPSCCWVMCPWTDVLRFVHPPIC